MPIEESSNAEETQAPSTPVSSLRALLLGAGAVIVAVVLALVGIDFLLSGGEVASYRDVPLARQDDVPRPRPVAQAELTFQVEDIGQRHTLVLDTHPQELALWWTVSSPEGWILAGGRDVLRRDRRRTTHFVPTTAGLHVVRVERIASQPMGTSADRVNATIRVRDRSFLWRLFDRGGRFR